MSEHGAAPIGVSQAPSDVIPVKATEESLSLRSTRSTHHEEPVTTTTTGPSEKSQSSTSKAKPASTWYTALKTTVDLVVQVSDVFPPLKSTAAGIKALMDVHDVSSDFPCYRRILLMYRLHSQAFSSNQEEFEKLASRVEFLEKILRDRETLPPGIADRRDGLAR
jgi:hypothetical protein